MARKTARIGVLAALFCGLMLFAVTSVQAANWKVVTVLQVAFMPYYTDGTTKLCLTLNGDGLSATNVYFIGPDAASENRAFQLALTASASGLRMVIDLQTTPFQGMTFYNTGSVILQNVPAQ